MASTPDPDRRIGSYQIGEALGKGAFGTVYKGLDIETGETVAIKRVELTGIPQTELNNLEGELTLLQKLNHPNIVQYVGAVRSEKHLNIILEYIENGSLLTIIKKFGKFPETLAAVYVAQILEGLAYLHEQGVIHRDIKAANTLTTKDGEVKLADFGVATLSKAQRASGNMSIDQGALGSPYWMAPEIITMEGSKPASDIWSLGCTIIELMTGDPPFYSMPPMSAMYHIAETEEMPPFPENASPELVDFLKVCFERNPDKRPSAVKLLQHDWVLQSKARKHVASVKMSKNTHRKNMRSETHWEAQYKAELDSPHRETAQRTILRTNSSGGLGLAAALDELNLLEETLEDLRQQVIIEVRNNQLLESDVKRLDKKIELLIRNRISLEEVLSSPKASREEASPSAKRETSESGEIQNWKSGPLVEGYARLFYLLQTNPAYLSGFIFFQFEGGEKFVETLILTLFGFAFSPREEFLLLNLFHAAIQREIGNLTAINAFSDEAGILLGMIIAYCRRVQEQDFLRHVLGKSISGVIEMTDLNLEIDPKKVWKNWINTQETKTGEINQQLDPNASEDQILEHPEVREIVLARVTQLLEVAETFAERIISSRDRFPYGLSQILHQLRVALDTKFKSQEKSIFSLLGYIVYYRFMNPVIVGPEDLGMAPLSMQQRVNLIAVSKILSLIANNRSMEGTGPHVKLINSHIAKLSSRFHDFLDLVTKKVQDPAEYLKIDTRYLEYTQTHRPVIYISPNEMFMTHRAIQSKIDKIAPEPEDELRKLILSMPEPPPSNTTEPRLSREMPLTLAPTLAIDGPATPGGDLSSKASKLYTVTKKMIADIIKDTYKDTLGDLDLLGLLTGPEASGHSKLTQTIGKILENLEKLEARGLVSKKDRYKSILEDIQQDLWQKASMRSKLEKERAQLTVTMERLQEKKTYLNEQLTAYNNYVKACLEQSVSLSKKKTKDPKGSLRKKGSTASDWKKITHKYSCTQLVKKGVIVEIGVSSSQQSSISFEIEDTPQVGHFIVKVFVALINMETIAIELDDLLEKQDNGVYILELIDGRVKLRTNLLVHLLNKIAVERNK
jgi:serine/threonine protein kinase